MSNDWINPQIKKEIGLVEVLDKLVVISQYGMSKKLGLKPFLQEEIQYLIQELDDVSIVKSFMENSPQICNSIIRILKEIKDIRGSFERALRNEILNEIELFEIKNQLMVMAELRRLLLREEELSIEKIKLINIDDIIKLLDPEETGTRTFYIYDKYSTLLTELRDNIAHIEKQMWIEKKKSKGNLQSRLDESSNNARNESLEVLMIELENLKIKEEEEELRIRKWLSLEIKNNNKVILQNINAIGELDFMLAKARLAIETKSVKPNIVDKGRVTFVDGRHIPLESYLKEKGTAYTPIDIELHEGVTVITGSNMGGKTVSLKLVGLIVAMAQLGFYVPAKKATVGLFDFIYFSSGDQQSIQSGLSTFGGEIHGLSKVLNRNGKKGLVLIDELARGTNPIEGYGISKGIITYLKKSTFVSLITTHFDGLSNIKGIKHLQVVGLKNIEVDSLKAHIQKQDYGNQILEKYMDYRLEEIKEGTKVPKDAILVAGLMGLNKEILDIAKRAVEEVDR
ncbi:MutS-related protein [Alkaliphilus sp. B6464]|uniref:lysine 5,6-aminomutase reactivase ATPase KamC n=1 Tax=Alkaliphilus sp. B6464 TaxID=2731219 RepID=UPI001BA4B06C|nr:DNA mismatch repair protein MutS [Alkaliphilus sp. B6464]QUH19806.1 DNA mismatch repair protein MutS [Alkaliphilus sp. B6464]